MAMKTIKRLLTRIRTPRAMGTFSEDVRHAMGLAGATACQCNCAEVQPIHILFGLLATDSGPHITALEQWHVDVQACRDSLHELLSPDPSNAIEPLRTDGATRKIIQATMNTAQQQGEFEISSTHLLICLLRSSDTDIQTFVEQHNWPVHNISV